MSSSSFKVGSCLVYLPLLLISCGSNYVEGQANFCWEYVARDMIIPLVAPFDAAARKSGCLFGGGWKYQDNPDDKPRRPPFPFFDASPERRERRAAMSGKLLNVYLFLA